MTKRTFFDWEVCSVAIPWLVACDTFVRMIIGSIPDIQVNDSIRMVFFVVQGYE
jgi:hypothetical protein